MWNNFGVFARCKQLCGHMWYSLKFRVNFKKGSLGRLRLRNPGAEL